MSTTISLHTQFQIGEVDPQLFGVHAEHLGRCIYEGIYDPKSSHADDDGIRTDVLAALRELGHTHLRWPGGNFTSGYHWMDGVGPRDQRPTLHEVAWNSIETNHFGTDECMALCRKMGCEPMLAVNLGTGTPEEAWFWSQYCNDPAGSSEAPVTRYAAMRVANGHPDPYDVRMWVMGNELDVATQPGYTPAHEYAVRAFQTARLMKGIDLGFNDRLKIIYGGSCNVEYRSYLEWDRQVLEYVYENDPEGKYIDYINLHRYAHNWNDDTADFLGFSNAIDEQIEQMDAVCRFAAGKHRVPRRAYLVCDEWGVWYKDHRTDGAGKFAPHLIEEVFNLQDALVIAMFLNSFLRHADVLKIASLSQMVNVLSPLLTDGDRMLRQSIFYAFKMFSDRKNGTSLTTRVNGPTYETATYGRVPYIDSSAILDGNRLSVFLINRRLDTEEVVRLEVSDRRIESIENGEVLTDDDPKAANSYEDPDRIRSVSFDQVKMDGRGAEITMPPLSLVALTLRLA